MVCGVGQRAHLKQMPSYQFLFLACSCSSLFPLLILPFFLPPVFLIMMMLFSKLALSRAKPKFARHPVGLNGAGLVRAHEYRTQTH